MKYLIIILLIIIPVSICAEENMKNGYNELFYQANQYYKQGRYDDALDSYMEITKSGIKSGDLFYNIGNVYYRLKMTGRSILYYEKAFLFMPRDSDLDYNLRYLENLTKDAVDQPDPVVSSILFWTKSMTAVEIFMIFAVINALLWLSFIIRLFIKKEWTYYLPFIFLTIWVICGISWAWKTYSVKTDSRAVVVSEEINVFSGPDEREKILFQLHTGTIVLQERKEDNWKLIRLEDRRNESADVKRGWVKSAEIERIRPEGWYADR